MRMIIKNTKTVEDFKELKVKAENLAKSKEMEHGEPVLVYADGNDGEVEITYTDDTVFTVNAYGARFGEWRAIQ